MDYAPPPDYAAFLQHQLTQQQAGVASYRLGGAQVWLKRAGPRHGMGRYRVLGAIAGALRLDVLRPIPNLGGRPAIATEVRRLRELAARGLRVPRVLAAQEDGFLMLHLGGPAQHTPSLADEMNAAVNAGPEAVLALWRQGLQALRHVHESGACLSQAFARNLVRCPDGVMGYIDFEDDPAAVLPLPQCQSRDALCFVHSTALYLRMAGALDDARPVWQDWMQACPTAMHAVLAHSIARMGWLRHLPQSRRLGRDLQRARAAHDLLTPHA
ncbi:hypothetical protein [Paenacidovorax monticola]|uniref:Serine/threonine protein phosphatase n=1 Tax=Paenacidovorax monticola TaxID=1926868 RepID=A0A7H0HBX8_9BURK|nr:hypothetical protein [Paenacidovorax monticola]QNP58044.1 hypothetical protein H9L24_13125 [Paenacidovorax monticola]